MRRHLVCGLLLGVLCVGTVQAESRLEKAEAKERARIAAVWVELARSQIEDDLKREAGISLMRARRADPGTDGLAELEQQAAALGGKGEVSASMEKRIETAQREAAKGYDRLAKVFDDTPSDPRRIEALWQAIELDPAKARVTRLAEEAQKGFLLVRTPTHPFVASLSLPKSWRAGRTYPVLVSVEGAGCNFQGNAQAFRNARGSRDWITLSPHALSCTNELERDKYPAYDQALLDQWNAKRVEFDVTGLLGVLDFIGPIFGAEPKIAITGFSGGGNLCYGFLFRHPDRVRCAAPACANFQPGLAQGAMKVDGGGPPVHVLTGEKDPHRDLTHGKFPPGIEEQTDWAMKAFEAQGFTQVKRTMLPGVGHSACPQEVWAFVDEVSADR